MADAAVYPKIDGGAAGHEKALMDLVGSMNGEDPGDGSTQFPWRPRYSGAAPTIDLQRSANGTTFRAVIGGSNHLTLDTTSGASSSLNWTITGTFSAGAITATSLTTTGAVVVGTNLTVNGNTVLGNAAGDTVTTAGPLTVGTTLEVGTDLEVNGDASIDGGLAVGVDLTVDGNLDVDGDSFLQIVRLIPDPAADQVLILKNNAAAGQVALGAENTATPDLIFWNNGNVQIGRITNEGVFLAGAQTTVVGTAAAGDVQANDLWLVNGSNFRRLLVTSDTFQISADQDGSTIDLTMDVDGTVTIHKLVVDTDGIDVSGPSSFDNAVTITAGPLTVPDIDPPASDGEVSAGGLCKAYARVTGSSGALGDNHNIASVTRNGAGDYSISWDRDFNSSTYAVLVSVEDNGSTLFDIKCNSKIAGSADIHVRDDTGTLVDPDFFSVACFGTLA